MQIVAHRGLHQRCAENTLGAFIAAAKARISWVECDVWPSADGGIAVIHDQTLDRTTTGTGKVDNQSTIGLRGLQVPMLFEVLEVLPDNVGILIEIKPADDAAFVRSVLNGLSGCRQPWILQSFHAENLIHANAIDRNTPVAMLIEAEKQLRPAIDSGWSMIHVEHSLIEKDLVDQLHAAGRKIGAWTVNDRSEIQRMIDLGIDMLITDEPELATRLYEDQRPLID